MRIIKKHIPAWFPHDLIAPFLYLSGCSLLVTGLIVNSFFHIYLQALWWWLPWNIFLAGLPLFFAICVLWASHGKQRVRRLLILPCWVLWLFFYPNAPYMLTNLIHLNHFEFILPIKDYRLYHMFFGPPIQFSGDPAVWFVFLILIAGVAVGSGLGSLSLVMLQRHVAQERGVVWSWLLVAGISLLSGIGIWIGRILRFNSWDMVFRPFYLIRNIARQFNWDAFLLCILFAIMSAGAYLLLQVFLTKELRK